MKDNKKSLIIVICVCVLAVAVIGGGIGYAVYKYTQKKDVAVNEMTDEMGTTQAETTEATEPVKIDPAEVAVTINGTDLLMDELLYYIYETEAEGNSYEEFYQSYFGESFWDSPYDEEGNTYREVSKTETMDSAVMYHILSEKAKEKGYVLSDEEKATCTEDATAVYDSLTEYQKGVMGITLEKLTEIQEKYILAEYYYNDMIEELDIDEEAIKASINKDEYRGYEIEYVYGATLTYDEEGNESALSDEEVAQVKKDMEAIFEKAKAGEDFEGLVPEDETGEALIEYGETSFVEGDELFGAEIEKAALALENDEVATEMLEGEDGFYIIKMINNNSDEYYVMAQDDAVTEKTDELFQEAYNKLKETYTIEINTELWDAIVMGDITYDPDAVYSSEEDWSSSSSSEEEYEDEELEEEDSDSEE